MSQNKIDYKTAKEITSYLAPEYEERQIMIHVLVKGETKRMLRIHYNHYLWNKQL